MNPIGLDRMVWKRGLWGIGLLLALANPGLAQEEDAPVAGEEVGTDEAVETAEEAGEEEDANASSGNVPFVEGELAAVGALGFVPWRNRVGVILGTEQIGEVFYGAATPHVNYTDTVWDRELSMSFGIPLRFEILDARIDRRWENAGAFRSKDWDEFGDYFQVINRIVYGSKESHVYVDINSFRATSIGHGTQVKRYNPNLNYNSAKVAAEIDGFTDYGGGEVYLDNIAGPNVVGALGFFKPLSFVDRDNFMMRSFSLGFSFFADVDAPVRNFLDDDDVDGDGRRYSEIRIDQETFQPEYTSTPLLAYGIDAEVKVWDERELDWKTYLDYSFLQADLPVDGGAVPASDDVPTELARSGGLTFGNLFRMNFGEESIHAVRVRVEYRNYAANYLPSYFDSMYEVQRVQYPDGLGDLANGTKLQRVLGRDQDGARVNGGYIEAGYRFSNYFATALGFEMNDETADNSLFFHVEVPQLGPWQFLATYQRRNVDEAGEFFEARLREADLLIMQTRYGIVDVVHLTFDATTPFGLTGSESLFRNTLQFNMNLEIGFPYL